METVNDIDGDIVNFWAQLRDNGDELQRVCALTPHSRLEHKIATEPAPNDLERARRTWVRLTQGRSSSMRNTGWRHFAARPVAPDAPQGLRLSSGLRWGQAAMTTPRSGSTSAGVGSMPATTRSHDPGAHPSRSSTTASVSGWYRCRRPFSRSDRSRVESPVAWAKSAWWRHRGARASTMARPSRSQPSTPASNPMPEGAAQGRGRVSRHSGPQQPPHAICGAV
jgi:hypothetical protein